MKTKSTRKSRKPSEWNLFVKDVWNELKKLDKDVSFGDAMKEASKRKKKM
jgi:hypothetical protein